VLLGVHYPTDIAAGALLGITSTLLALGVWEWI
jgi:undecaprenyl-diphosphatase